MAPSYEAIAGGEYKVSRPLFIYAKKQHVGTVPGMAEFVEEYVSEKAIGEDGYLAAKGLVTLPGEEAAKTKAAAEGHGDAQGRRADVSWTSEWGSPRMYRLPRHSSERRPVTALPTKQSAARISDGGINGKGAS